MLIVDAMSRRVEQYGKLTLLQLCSVTTKVSISARLAICLAYHTKPLACDTLQSWQ